MFNSIIKRYLLSLSIVLFSMNAPSILLGQGTTIRVLDTAKAPLEFVSILVLHSGDSTIIDSGLTDHNGSFTTSGDYSGKFVLQAHYISYRSFNDVVDFSPTGEIKIELEPNPEELETIEVISEHLSFKGLGDTVEYNTAHLINRPGDVVEDLLRKLPGIEVKRDGTLKAYGEDVKNVLVDGKEFFGRDTRTATKNLDADAIDKVQVFDKASDMAELTGVKDGRDEKTINLKLKEGYKNGYFGKAEANANYNGQYDSRGNFNNFNPKARISILGLANNVNSEGFSFNDYMSFMGGVASLGRQSAGGGVRVELDDNIPVPIGGQNSEGITRTWASGINLNYEFSDRSNLSAHYFYNNSNQYVNTTSQLSYFVKYGLFNSRNILDQTIDREGHNLNYNWKYQLDTLVELKLRGAIGFNTNESETQDQGNTENNGLLVNEQSSFNDLRGSSYRLASSLLLKKKFKTRGKALIAQLGIELKESDQNSLVKSQSNLVAVNEQQSVLQNQIRDNRSRHLESSLAYTMPVGKKSRYVQIDGILSSDYRESSALFYDVDSTLGAELNTDFSNKYFMDFWYSSIGAKQVLSREAYNLTVGLYYQHSELSGMTSLSDSGVDKTFNVFLPLVYMDYNFGAAHRLSVEYRTSLYEPRIDQLQPVVDNRDPLNIYKGNPNLNAEYAHRLGVSYLNYDAFSFSSLYGRLGISVTTDKITDVIMIDSTARRVIQPFNISQEYTGRGSFEHGRPIRPLGITAKIKLSVKISKGLLYLNNIENNVTRLGSTVDFSIENRKKNAIDLLLGYRQTYNETLYSEDLVEDQYYKESTVYAALKWTSKNGLGVKSNVDWVRFSDPFVREQLEQLIWDVELSKTLGSRNQFLLKLSAHDLLNSNKGVRRFSELNYYQFQQSNVLGRYVMVGLAYNLRGFKKDDTVMKIKFGD